MQRDEWAAYSSTLALAVTPAQKAAIIGTASRIGITPEQLVIRAVRHYAAALGAAALVAAPDNGDEYGQRVVVHEIMVRSMGK